jgi:hypothetical protein
MEKFFRKWTKINVQKNVQGKSYWNEMGTNHVFTA